MADDEAPARTSNIFSKFNKNMIQEFKEAFTMIDQDRDGVISKEDLKEIHETLGSNPSAKDLETMVGESKTAINFTVFLQMMGDKLHGTDSEEALRSSFQMFDPENKGTLPEEYFKDLLENMGDNFSKDELKQTWKEMPLEKGLVDYQHFVSIIKGKMGDDELAA